MDKRKDSKTVTNAKKSTPANSNTLVIKQAKDESDGKALARAVLSPSLRHGHTASTFVAPLLGETGKKPGLNDYADLFHATGDKAEAGNLAFASRTLAAQAMTLDTMFTELARRAALNMGEYINAAERYGRLALKAQSNCRTTLEALAKLHQPREQTVKHVHVNEGGQAVVADHFHQNTGGQENGKANEQPYATGTGAAGQCSALPCPDPLGEAVPMPSREGEPALSNARRQGKRRA